MWSFVCTYLLVGMFALNAPLTLVNEGKSSYAIVLPSKATPAEKRAARELKLFVKQVSGAKLAVRTDDQPLPSRAILLGTRETNRHIRALGADVSKEGLGEEGYRIVTKGNYLILGGARPRGTLYAVYGFLGDQLGCRWYAADCSRIPHKPTITLSALDIVTTPAFEYREPFYTEAWPKNWAARNRCNGTHPKLDEETGGKIGYYPWAHSFQALVPAKKYAQTHPEYYSEIDSKRTTEGAQLCLTNPEVVKAGAAQVEKWIAKHPEAKMISISQNDWAGCCTCANCKRVIEEEGSPAGALLRFVNAIAAEVEKGHPDKLIDTLAYQWTEKPPRITAPRANVRVRLAPISNCFAHPCDTCPENKGAYENLCAWSKLTHNLYIWHYNTNFGNYVMPFPDFDELQGSTRAYQKLGVKGIFFQGAYACPTGGGEFAELRSWVLARLLWNPEQDVWELVDEFLNGYYGKAAPAMREYMDLLHKAVKQENIHFRIYDSPEKVGYLRRDLVDRAEALFVKAEEAVTSSPQELARVQKARLAIDYVRYKQAQTKEERQKYAAIVAEKVRRFKVSELKEGQPAKAFLKELEKEK